MQVWGILLCLQFQSSPPSNSPIFTPSVTSSILMSGLLQQMVSSFKLSFSSFLRATLSTSSEIDSFTKTQVTFCSSQQFSNSKRAPVSLFDSRNPLIPFASVCEFTNHNFSSQYSLNISLTPPHPSSVKFSTHSILYNPISSSTSLLISSAISCPGTSPSTFTLIPSRLISTPHLSSTSSLTLSRILLVWSQQSISGFFTAIIIESLMEYPVYSYQSTMYNFIPFLVNYEFLSDTLIDASAAVEDFNGVFEKGLMRLVGNCGNIELPTLKNLYEEVVLLIKDSFTKTSHIQTALAKVSSSISTCVIKLHQTYKEHLEEIGKRADELQKVKRDIEQTQVKISHINERVLLLTEAETVDKFYKLNYKEPYYPLHSKAITQLQNQIAIQHSMMEYYEENMEYEGVKNKKLCGILSNELEEAMINTTFVEVSAGRKEEGKGRSSYQPRVSATVEEACIRVERGKFPEGEELLVKVKAMKEEVDNLLDRLEYE